MSDRVVVYPGLVGGGAAADARRSEFDSKNTAVVLNDVPVDVVFAGDSITHLWELNAYFRSFGLVLNRGIWGDITETLGRRFEADVLQLHPRVCVLMIGVNNLGVYEWDPPYTVEQALSYFEKHYRALLDQAKAAGQKMILCSLLPMRNAIFPNLGKRRVTIPQQNRIIRRLADEYGYPFVDYFSAVVDRDGLTLRDGLSFDGLHPTWACYNIMADCVRPALEKALGPAASR